MAYTTVFNWMMVMQAKGFYRIIKMRVAASTSFV